MATIEVSTVPLPSSWLRRLKHLVTTGETRASRTKHNTRATFSRIPFDIWLRIVFILYDDFFSRWTIEADDTVGHWRTKRKGNECIVPAPWRPLMNTCTYSRSTLLSMSQIWGYLDTDWNRDWFRLCVYYAQSSQLLLLFHTRPVYAYRGLTGGSTEQRIKNFDFLVARSEEENVRASLRLSAMSYTGSVWHPEDASWCNELNHCWAQMYGSTSRLTRLSLHATPLDSDLVTCPSLTLLTMSKCRFTGKQRQLYRTIAQAMPRLEQLMLLRITCTTVPANSEDIATDLEGLIPSLKKLTVEGGFLAVVDALYALAVPSDELTLSVTPDKSTPSARKLYLRGLIFDRILLGPAPTHLDVRDVIRDHDAWLGRPSFAVTFEQPKTTVPRTRYTDRDEDLQDLATVFRHSGVVRIHGKAVTTLFSRATVALDVLSSIDHIELVDAEGGIYELAAWIGARALQGRPIQMVNFVSYDAYSGPYGLMSALNRATTDISPGMICINGATISP
jgi:hypothetical protein